MFSYKGRKQLPSIKALERTAVRFLLLAKFDTCETPADVSVRIRRVVVQVQGESASVRAVVPIRAQQ